MPGEKLCCCLCSLESIEQKTVDRLGGQDEIPPYTPSKLGLLCSMCNKFSCFHCLFYLLYVIPKKVQKKDKWCKIVNKYLYKGYWPKKFVGHCCELKKKQLQLGLDKVAAIQNTRFDGHLYLPEFAIIIDSPFDCVDVHGLGGSKLLPAVWHCVFSHMAAEAFFVANVCPDGQGARLLDDEAPCIVEFELPYTGGNKLKVCCVVLSSTFILL